MVLSCVSIKFLFRKNHEILEYVRCEIKIYMIYSNMHAIFEISYRGNFPAKTIHDESPKTSHYFSRQFCFYLLTNITSGVNDEVVPTGRLYQSAEKFIWNSRTPHTLSIYQYSTNYYAKLVSPSSCSLKMPSYLY